MRKTALALIVIVTFSFLFWGTFIQPVESQSSETIYIKSDGSVEGTHLIERNNNTYTFLNDISGNIVISKDFITIDGSGYALKGSNAASQTGISLSNRKNVTVTNLVIMNYSIGIEFLGSSNNLITYNAFKNNAIDIAINYVLGNNLITHNNLNSYVQVWMSDQPTIDMNYWADYNGTDSDGDRIGDSPYFYHDILQDNHPLMEPVPLIPEFSPWVILPLFTIATILLMLVYFKKHEQKLIIH